MTSALHLARTWSIATLFVLPLLGASVGCGEPPPPHAAPPPRAVGPDIEGARRAADAAMRNLAKRRFQLENCSPGITEIMATEAEAHSKADTSRPCSVIAVRRPDAWYIVIRSGSSPQNPQARAVVSPGGEGVKKVDYAR